MFRQFICCFLTLLFFAGISGAEESSHKTLRWMGHWKGEGLREQLVCEIKDELQFLHQDVEIDLRFAKDVFPDANQRIIGEMIAEMIQSGRLDWDVVWMDQIVYKAAAVKLNDPDWGSKYLVDLSEFDDIKAAHQPFLFDGPNCHKNTGGVFVGPYIEGYYSCLWYNTVVAEKLGLQIREEEMNADDFLQSIRRVKEYNETAETPINAIGEYMWSGSFYRLAQNLLLSVRLKHPETPPNEILSRILYYLEDIQSCEPFLYDPESYKAEDVFQLLLDDEALFMINPTWCYTTIDAHFPGLLDKLRPAQVPGFEQQSFYVADFIPTWAVMKNSPVRDICIELMRLWCSPKVAQKWVRFTKCPTGLSGNFYESEYGLDPIAAFQNKLKTGRTRYPDVILFRDDESAITPIWKYINRVILGEMTAEEALVEMEKENK